MKLLRWIPVRDWLASALAVLFFAALIVSLIWVIGYLIRHWQEKPASELEPDEEAKPAEAGDYLIQDQWWLPLRLRIYGAWRALYANWYCLRLAFAAGLYGRHFYPSIGWGADVRFERLAYWVGRLFYHLIWRWLRPVIQARQPAGSESIGWGLALRISVLRILSVFGLKVKVPKIRERRKGMPPLATIGAYVGAFCGCLMGTLIALVLDLPLSARQAVFFGSVAMGAMIGFILGLVTKLKFFFMKNEG